MTGGKREEVLPSKKWSDGVQALRKDGPDWNAPTARGRVGIEFGIPRGCPFVTGSWSSRNGTDRLSTACRELNSEGARDAQRVVKSRGVRLGNPNVEQSLKLMRKGSQRTKTEFRSKILPVIEEIRRAGVYTLKGISECLNARGIKTRTGKTWFPTTVRLVVG